MDGPAGTPCTRAEPDAIAHYNTDPTEGRPYQTTGDITRTSPEVTTANPWPASNLVQIQGVTNENGWESEKTSVLQTPWGKTRTTYYAQI